MRVSAALPNEPAEDAVNGLASDRWGAGAPPPQWIQIDLGDSYTVASVRLTTSQSPAGRTVHQIWAGPSPGNLSLVHTFDGATEDMQFLHFEPAVPIKDVRYLRVTTTLSPSWVAWREIEVSAP